MIKILFFLLALLSTGTAFSQSNLPACHGTKSSTWNNCLGVFNYFYGAKDVIEYQNGMRNGQGIEYDKNGSVLNSGTWRNNQQVSSHSVDKSKFPFPFENVAIQTFAIEPISNNIPHSNLPVCQGTKSSTWHNCWGVFNYFYGGKDVNEYQNGMRNGQGIEYDKKQ